MASYAEGYRRLEAINIASTVKSSVRTGNVKNTSTSRRTCGRGENHASIELAEKKIRLSKLDEVIAANSNFTTRCAATLNRALIASRVIGLTLLVINADRESRGELWLRRG